MPALVNTHLCTRANKKTADIYELLKIPNLTQNLEQAISATAKGNLIFILLKSLRCRCKEFV